MPKMVSQRTFRLETIHGVAVSFEAKVPTYVPPNAVSDAMQVGCIPVDENDAAFFEDAERARVEFAGDARRSMIWLAVKDLVARNKTTDFDAGGNPKVASVADVLGFEVSKSEVTDIFRMYTQVESEGGTFALHPASDNIMRVIGADTKAEVVELAKEFGVEEDKAKGMTMKDLRKFLLVKLGGTAA